MAHRYGEYLTLTSPSDTMFIPGTNTLRQSPLVLKLRQPPTPTPTVSTACVIQKMISDNIIMIIIISVQLLGPRNFFVSASLGRAQGLSPVGFCAGGNPGPFPSDSPRSRAQGLTPAGARQVLSPLREALFISSLLVLVAFGPSL